MANTSIFSQGPPAWLQQRALIDTESVLQDTSQVAGMLGRLTGTLIGAGIKSAQGQNFLSAFGDMWRKSGSVQEQAAWNKVQDMNIDLDQKKKEIFDQGIDAPKFAKWQQDMAKDPNTVPPKWMSDKYRQAAFLVDQQANMKQYRMGMVDVYKNRAQNSLVKQNNVNDFTAALGAIDPEISADIENPDNGLVRVDQQGNIIGYTGDAVRALNEGLAAKGLTRFGPGWSKNQAAADLEKTKQAGKMELQTDKFSHISELLNQKEANAQALQKTKDIYAAAKDKASFIARMSSAMALNPSYFGVKKGEVTKTVQAMADDLFPESPTGAAPSSSDKDPLGLFGQ